MREPESMIHHDPASALWELGWEAEASPADAIAQAKDSSHGRAKAVGDIADDLRKMGTTVDAWFAGIDTHATFLGKRIEASSGSVPGVHRVLLERLRRVEDRLVKELRTSSLADCARQLNVYQVKGLRAPKAATGGSRPSMHCYGLAIDVNYRGNPFLQAGHKSVGIIERATQLVTGKAENVLSNPPDDAGRTWDWLHGMSNAFKVYFQLRDPANLRHLAALASRSGHDPAWWRDQIEGDYHSLDRRDSFVSRDPAKGFLDLDRRLVVALVEAGGLLWGGQYKSGKDLMHFDWRGPRKDRNDPRSWSAAAIVDKAPVARTTGAPRPDMSAPGLTIYAPIPLGKDCKWARGKDGKLTCIGWFSLPARTGIYFPERFQDRQDLDVIIYLHGHLIPACGTQHSDQIDQYWKRPRFLLREGLNQARRSFVLVVPSLGPQSQSGSLHRAGGFDNYMKQVQAAILRQAAASGLTRARDIGRIILSCHSGGGSTMRAIATSSGTYARRIRECWGFDCLYGANDAKVWSQWAQANRNARLYVHYTEGGGTKFQSERLRDRRLANVVIPEPSRYVTHCDVPKVYWQRRIHAALPAPSPVP